MGSPETAPQELRPPAADLDKPSGKYHEIEEPNPALRRRASEPPRPVLPRERARRHWTATGRERDPLQASLTGSGRAGKPGRLLGSSGAVYEGDVLAGRPHGWGRYFAAGPEPAAGLVLHYEGEFRRGVREGLGTLHLHAATPSETYVGHFSGGLPHGRGRRTYTDGTVFDGEWVRGVRHGAGRLTTRGGDVFVGEFVSGKRQGLGVLFLPGKGTKYLGEWVDDAPVCGSVLPIASGDLEPPELVKAAVKHALAARPVEANTNLAGAPGGADGGAEEEPQQDAAAVAAASEAAAAAASKAVGLPWDGARLPPVRLAQPAKVLAREIVAVRGARQPAPDRAACRSACGDGGTTLPAERIALLEQAFTLMTGSEGRAARLPEQQLPELAVLAGLDPAVPSTSELLLAVRSHCDRDGDGVSLDALMHAAAYFRERPLAVGPLADQPIAAGSSVRRTAVAGQEANGNGVGAGGQGGERVTMRLDVAGDEPEEGPGDGAGSGGGDLAGSSTPGEEGEAEAAALGRV